MSKLISAESLLPLLRDDLVNIIDVRAPVEFAAGSIPKAINLPILTDEERAEVGTTYKRLGPAKAVAVGHELVSGEIKNERVKKWRLAVEDSAKPAILTCFRGGLRSQITQQWLEEASVSLPRIEGGYKKMRQLFIDEIKSFSATENLLVLTGNTGAGKTELLRSQSSLPFLRFRKASSPPGFGVRALFDSAARPSRF